MPARKASNQTLSDLLDLSAARTILDSIADGVFTVGPDWHITYFNRAAELITGIPREQAIGRTCREIFRASICDGECALRQAIATRKPVVNRAIFINTPRGNRVPISISAALLRDAKGTFIGGVETFRDLSLMEELRKDLLGRHSLEDIISCNPRMKELFNLLPLAARSDSTVLVLGESGTGKELVARAIHNLSSRASKPMITVNCGALPETLLESELFGYKAGAFTDAKRDKPGRFALAEGGTIFLDEIGELTPLLQVKLLRVLQEHTYEPLGSTKPQKANVRVVTATNRDLEKMVQDGRFREDLFYRINIMKILLPPLRDRKDDVPLLVEHFIQRFNRIRGSHVTGIAREALDLLRGFDYPGNIRQLENIIEYCFILCHDGDIMPEHLPLDIRSAQPAELLPFNDLKEAEARFIIAALAKNGYDKNATARTLDMHPVTLWRKMKRYGISSRVLQTQPHKSKKSA